MELFEHETKQETQRNRTVKAVRRLLLGAIAGLAVGMVVAVNLVIYAGIGDGYETRLDAIFDQNAIVAVIVVALWVLSPAVGAYVAWRQTQS